MALGNGGISKSRKSAPSRRGVRTGVSQAVGTATAAKNAKTAKTKNAMKKPAGRGYGAPCIVGIGASAGGLDAIREFLRAMPAGSGVAFVVIQHLDPQHKSLAAELLAKCTAMPVTEAEHGVQVAPNHVYTSPPGTIVSIKGGVLRLTRAAAGDERRLPIDHFFRALGEDQRERAIGIIFSGSGADGAFGLRTIVENGGMVIAQQPDSAQFDGMPRSAIQTGLVSAVLPIAKMPRALIEYARHPYAEGAMPSAVSGALGQIMELMRSRHGFDFSGYKRAMLLRRIQRRMGLRGVKQPADYVRVLAAEAREADALFKDLLIGVTEFFRDQAAWDDLDAEVIVPLVASRGADEAIRVWVAGVATGEEAYSIAMLLCERVRAAGKRCPVQVFASDTSEDALAIARAGIYPAGIAARVSAQRLRRFFIELPDKHQYQVCEELRSCIVFCAHNLLRDPPYSNMDIVTCRNLLIYLDPETQKKAIRIMHFALRQGGTLFLGAAETLGEHDESFQPVSKKWRIFRRMGAAHREPMDFSVRRAGLPAAGLMTRELAPRATDSAALVQRVIMERFAPAAVLTDDKCNALYFCGPTDRFLQHPKGGPTQDLLALSREGLRSRLRSAIRQAGADGSTVVVNDARVRRGDAFEPVRLTVSPAGPARDRGGLLLVVFEDAPVLAPVPLDRKGAAARLINQLEEDLRTTREDLTSVIERQELSVDALRASNEEVVSANEELQSMNEELESSKEELQSLNEELNTVNQQLEGKVRELEDADSDLQNLLASSEIATVCLDGDFRIKWFSPTARQLLSLVPSDIGRPVNAFAPLLSDPAVISDAKKVISNRARGEAEVCVDAPRGRQWFLRRTLPYRTHSDTVSGVIISYTDITDIHLKAEAQIATSLEQSQSLEAQVEQRVRLLHSELFKLATSEERERHEIATALHDELCQPLAALNLRLTMQQRVAAGDGKPLAELAALAETAERAARSLMYRISPPVLFDMGLRPALEWLAEEMQRSYGLSVKVSGDAPGRSLSIDATVLSVLFRCVRELLVNVAKHAKVHEAAVSIAVQGGKVAVSVTDAGVGFDPALTAGQGVGSRFGLVSVRERVAYVDGSFKLDSIPGDGTAATITVPLIKRTGAPRKHAKAAK